MRLINTLRKHKVPYLFILPFFILFSIFQLYPIVWTVWVSLTKWNGIKQPVFIGLNNYNLLLNDYMFTDAFFNTVVYWVTGVIFIIILSLGIASLLNYNNLKGKGFFKVVTFLPNVSAAIAIGIIFSMLFDKNIGIINEVISLFGINKIGWLTTVKYSKIPVIILNIWRNTPWFTLIILSGLLNIPEEYYEAARIDGANKIQQFFKITLPNLTDILFFCFIILTVNSWKIFNESYILKGPSTSNMSLFQYMYQSGFTAFKMGYASAIGVVLIIILAIVSVVQFILMRKNSEI
ncbi:ABC transporter permease subunit [Iocasia frigidifontis]|uniref:ABC transporter permease subunit n=1 Tax=Iocasia fonsfrigidae TaxID=2682810 RepID=A0A8A7KCU4_9FIRM|nr:sugar ABC transporter permease [Iocasia fonsfrigidae]QTL97428.1 ABC transporter permease subunit [Iocasia fonsfrigidae]